MIECSKCGQELSLTHGPFGPFLQCRGYPQCDITQGCDRRGNPLGAQSDAPTRDARKSAHRVFDVLWKHGRMTRTEAYAWLADQLGLSQEQTHIRLFDVPTCMKVISVVQEALKQEAEIRRANRAAKAL